MATKFNFDMIALGSLAVIPPASSTKTVSQPFAHPSILQGGGQPADG